MKGGAGKTMVSVNVAACLSEEARVLVVDVDPQCNASSALGIDIADPDIGTIVDVLSDHRTDPADVVVESPVGSLPNLDVLPSAIKLFLTEFELAYKAGRERLLYHYIGDNAEFFSRYDYIIIDTNPGLGVANQNAFFAADSIILATDVSDNGLTGIEMFQYLWGDVLCGEMRIPDRTRAIVVSNYDKRIGLAPQLLDYIKSRDDMEPLLVEPVVPYRVAYKDTEVDKLPINVRHPGSEAHQTISRLIDSLKEKGAL